MYLTECSTNMKIFIPVIVFQTFGLCIGLNIIPKGKGAINTIEEKINMAISQNKVHILNELKKEKLDFWKIFASATILENYDLDELLYFLDRNIPGAGFNNLASLLSIVPSIQKVKKFMHMGEKDPMVQVEEGWLRGIRIRPEKYRHFDAFMGIPYASKPTRFEHLKPMKPWSGVLDTQSEKFICVQNLPDLDDIVGSEDCIYANVATPSIKKKNLPVIVWVHGGIFKLGFGNMYYYGPDFIMQEDVVLVMFNYRLGALGFLCTDDDHLPANLGMKDMVFFLRWLQRNIRSFGGDPDNISLFGISTGAAAIQLLTLSPSTKGLFHKVITNSASIHHYWSYATDPVANVYRLAKNLDVPSSDIKTTISYLKKIDAKLMVRAAEKIYRDQYPNEEYLAFLPCPEKIIPGEEAFLTDYPQVILDSGNYTKYPTMIGFMDAEGIYWMVTPRTYSFHNDMVQYTIPRDLIGNLKTFKDKQELINVIKQFYFKGDIDESKQVQLKDFFSDTKMLYKLQTYVKKLVRDAPEVPLYYYEFGYDGNIGQTRVFGNVSLRGVAHADDCAYFFRILIDTDEGDLETEMVIKRQVKMLYNFAKYGDPTPNITDLLPVKWERVSSPESLEYLEVRKDIKMKEKPFLERFNFWDGLYKKYGL